jgi:hypothetical protein
MRFLLLAMLILICARISVRAEEPPYPGLLSEMKTADLIILLKADTVKSSDDRDPQTGRITREQVSGRITTVYKGDARKGQLIEIDVPYADQSLRVDGQLYRVGHLFFANGPRQGESLVFLLKGEQNHVVNIVAERPLIADYARIALLKNDSDIALELAKLYARLTLAENKTSYIGIPYVITDDLKRYYKYLDDKSDAFADMVVSFRKPIFRAAKEDDWDQQLFPAVWLGSYLPETDRKRLVRLWLDRYATNARKIEQLRNAAKVAPLLNEGADPSDGAPLPSPLVVCQNLQSLLIGSMNLVMDPSWHAQISSLDDPGELIPRNLRWGEKLTTDEVLAKATQFAAR